MINRIVLFALACLSLVSNYCYGIDYKYCEKLEFIDKLIANPQIATKIFEESDYYFLDIKYSGNDTATFVKGLPLFQNGYVHTIGHVESSRIIHSDIDQWEDVRDDITIHCFFDKDGRIVERSISFCFEYVHGYWRLYYISTNNSFHYTTSLSDIQDAEYIDNQKSLRNHSPSLTTKRDYDLCNNYKILTEILNNPYMIMAYSKYHIDSTSKWNDIENSSAFKELQEIADSSYLYEQYPFPINDVNISQYLDSDTLNLYYIIRHDPNKYITIEMTKYPNSNWFVSNLYNGRLIYLSANQNEYIPPSCKKCKK